MPPAIYSCTLWLDHGGFFGGAKNVAVFDTALDLENPASLQHALIAAIGRLRNRPADPNLYSLQVRNPGEPDAFLDYRYTPFLDDEQQA
jgi:hypothetical protein